MNIRRRARHHNMIPTASMADIAMLLLIFFMSTTIIRSHEAMDIRLPGAMTGDRIIRKETSIRISLGPSGEVAFNDARVSPSDVGRVLADKLRRNPELTVSLHADARAPYGDVAMLIDQIKLARAPQVTLVATRKGTP